MTTEGWLRDLVLRAIVESPLTPRDAAFLKKHLVGRLARGGHFRRQEEEDGIAGTFDWAFLSVLLNLAGDPECITLGFFAAGVRIGVGIGLPRARWILERKVKLRGKFRPEDERLTAGCREELVSQDNYQSALESMAGVRRVVQTELELGRIQRWTLREATAVYGQDLRFGSLGALCKGQYDDGVPDVRLLHDGTRGTDVNPYIRVRRVISRGSGFFTWAHRLAVRLRVKAWCCFSFAKSLGVPYQSGRWWYWCQLLGGKLKVGLHIIFWRVLRVGFLPVLVGVTLVVDSGSTPPFGKGEK